MRIKLDENLGRTHAALLAEQGHQVERTYEEGLSGEADQVVWEMVCAEDRFFITLDTDFSDVRRFPPGTHPGILLLRPRSRGRNAVLNLLRRVVEEHSIETLRGCLAVARETHTRIRRPG